MGLDEETGSGLINTLNEYEDSYEKAKDNFEKGDYKDITQLLTDAGRAMTRGAKAGTNIIAILKTFAPALLISSMKYLQDMGIISDMASINDSSTAVGIVVGASVAVVAMLIAKAIKTRKKGKDCVENLKCMDLEFAM